MVLTWVTNADVREYIQQAQHRWKPGEGSAQEWNLYGDSRPSFASPDIARPLARGGLRDIPGIRDLTYGTSQCSTHLSCRRSRMSIFLPEDLQALNTLTTQEWHLVK